MSDFVRGLVEPAKLSQLRDHVSGCAACGEAAAFYQRVQAAAFVPPEAAPPAIVAQAKAVFQTSKRLGKLRRATAKQILPGAGGWTMAGVRSAIHSGTAKHAVFKWVDFFVDLRAELQPETIRMSLVGQLANQTDPDGNLESVQVRLMTGQKTVAHAECNRLGEFALSFAPARRLYLEIDLPERQGLLKVPLKELNPEEMG